MKGSESDQGPRAAPAENQRILLFGYRLEEDTGFQLPVKVGSGIMKLVDQSGDLSVTILGLEEGLDGTNLLIKDGLTVGSLGEALEEVGWIERLTSNWGS
jgi:hypothetical protein